MSFTVQCTTESLTISPSGTVWGDVWLELDGQAFPERGWNDMPVAFISELVAAVVSVSSGKHAHQVRFFDGPFWVKLQAQKGGSLEVMLGQSYSAIASKAFPLDGVTESVSSVAKSLVGACVKQGWGETEDVTRLKAALSKVGSR